MSDVANLERRAERLARCYPAQWRARYGDEFRQLLVDELADRHRSIRRELNIVVHGICTRLCYSGLVGTVLEPRLRMRAKFAALAGVLTVFVILAAGVWSQPTVGWQWSAPAGITTRLGITIMSGALFGLGVLVAMFGVSVAGLFLVRLRQGGGLKLWCLALVFALAAATLWFGSDHFAAHWPGTGGHVWSGRGLAPAWLARVVWAATLWITTYWAHPAQLTAFPASLVVWMLVSPLAWLVLICSSARGLRLITLSRAGQRCAAVASAVALGLMTLFLAGAVLWMSSDRPGPRNLFAVGTIDLVVLASLAGGLTAATYLVRRVIAGSFRPIAG
jgi:hypothetical protein